MRYGGSGKAEIVDLSHVIEEGMTTYKGLPGPHICDFWTREGSAANYDDGSTFQIGRIDMVANTGTYLDSPFHRYADGADLSELKLHRSPTCRASSCGGRGRTISRSMPRISMGSMSRGKAVLVHTGWDRHWRTDGYFGEHPFLTAAAADWLVEQGAAFVGIDSCNIDNMHVRARPVHTRLLGAGIPICEHMTGLGSLPDERFPILRRAAQGEGHGDLPGARLRRAWLSERAFSQSGMIACRRGRRSRRCSTGRPSSG